MISTKIRNLVTLLPRKDDVIRIGHTELFKSNDDALFLKLGNEGCFLLLLAKPKEKINVSPLLEPSI